MVWLALWLRSELVFGMSVTTTFGVFHSAAAVHGACLMCMLCLVCCSEIQEVEPSATGLPMSLRSRGQVQQTATDKQRQADDVSS